MRYRFILLLAFIASISVKGFAQKSRYDDTNDDDTLTAAEINDINTAIRNSTFGYWHLADSCSKKGDSVCAGDYFLKVNPYCVLFEGQTPDSINGFIEKHFRLTRDAKEQYINLFTKVYNAPKSKAYYDFKKMADEDQRIRNKLEGCRDSLAAATAIEEMEYSDSVNFRYLYQYLKKHGWPSLADGSMYASILAIHDHDHHTEYLPIVKRAVLGGQLEPNVLGLIVYWVARSKESNGFEQYLATHTHLRYDITDAVDSIISPRLFPEIKKMIVEHCPVKLVYVDECKNKKLAERLLYKLFADYPKEANLLARLNMNLAEYDCGCSSSYITAMEMGLWSIRWQPSAHENIELIVYLVFETPEADARYKRLMAGEKFFSHTIQFQQNSAALTDDDLYFLSCFAAWLNRHNAVDIEIDGYTSNEGNTEANIALSVKRAEAVKKQFLAKGIENERLIIKGYGSQTALQTDDTPEGRTKNRRVEFVKHVEDHVPHADSDKKLKSSPDSNKEGK